MIEVLIQKQLEKLKTKDFIILILVAAKNYQKIHGPILKYLLLHNEAGIYLTLNKPFEALQRLFQEEHIDMRAMIFIDGATYIHGNAKKIPHCLYIGSPEKLSDISLAIDQALSSLPAEKKFLYLDSLTTLLMYNKEKTIAQFIHSLISKMRSLKVRGIIISLEKGADQSPIGEIIQFCDKAIEAG